MLSGAIRPPDLVALAERPGPFASVWLELRSGDPRRIASAVTGYGAYGAMVTVLAEEATMTDLTQTQTLARWAPERTIALRTRKRNGTMVSTPVSIAADGGHAFIRTYDASGKAKRLRNFPDVEIAPSTFRGKPTGPWTTAHARLLHGEEADRAAQAIQRKYPVLHRMVPRYHRLRGWQTVHYELHDISEPDGDADRDPRAV